MNVMDLFLHHWGLERLRSNPCLGCRNGCTVKLQLGLLKCQERGCGYCMTV